MPSYIRRNAIRKDIVMKYLKDTRFEHVYATKHKYFFKPEHIYFVDIRNESDFYRDDDETAKPFGAIINFGPSNYRYGCSIETPAFKTEEELYLYIKDKIGLDLNEDEQ